MKTSAWKALSLIAASSVAFSVAVIPLDGQVQLTYGQVSGVELDNDVTSARPCP